jgi:hypothetical protein
MNEYITYKEHIFKNEPLDIKYCNRSPVIMRVGII